MSTTASAHVETVSAKRYLGQFCKHFAHKLSVDLAPDNDSGEVRFGIGVCKLSADATRLDLNLEAETGSELDDLKNIVDRHLVRFGFRETIVLVWQ